MIVTADVAKELGFDLQEVKTYRLTVADTRRIRCPCIAPIEIKLNERSCTLEAAVLGDECLMGVVPLELMDLVVDAKRQCVTANPKHPDGPVFPAKGVRNIQASDEPLSHPQLLPPSQPYPTSA
jgi:hypothetical protein